MMNHQTRQKLAVASLTVVCMIASMFLVHAQAQNLSSNNLTVAGASPGGLWSSLGLGLDKVVSSEYPGSTVTYQTSSGGLANAKLVADKKVPLGIVSDMELKSAWEGTGVFRGRPQKDLRVLFRLFNAESRFQANHILLNRNFAREHGIESFDDLIRTKPDIRVAVNRPGNMDGDLGIAILEALGASIREIESWGGQVIRAATGEQTNLMTDRRLDLSNFGVSYNHASIRQMSNSIPLKMMDLTEPVAARVVANIGGKSCKFLKDEYDFLDTDATTVCTGTVLVASKDMDNDTAYALTKAMIENLDAFKSAHPQLAKVTTRESVAEGSVAPRHSGAERALREAGLLGN